MFVLSMPRAAADGIPAAVDILLLWDWMSLEVAVLRVD